MAVFQPSTEVLGKFNQLQKESLQKSNEGKVVSIFAIFTQKGTTFPCRKKIRKKGLHKLAHCAWGWGELWEGPRMWPLALVTHDRRLKGLKMQFWPIILIVHLW